MEAWMWILGLLPVMVAVVMFSRRSSPKNRALPRWIPGEPLVMSSEAMERIRAHLATGKKINAIKDLRTAASRRGATLGLKEAKDIVDAMAVGRSVPVIVGDGSGRGEGLAGRARALKAAGDLRAAVTLVRNETGMSLAEAERFVAALDE